MRRPDTGIKKIARFGNGRDDIRAVLRQSSGRTSIRRRVEEGPVRTVCLLFATAILLGACEPAQLPGCLSLGACEPTADEYGPVGPNAPKMRAKFLKEGFNLKVTHERWQFKPDLDELFTVCRNSIHHYAGEIATSKGKEIEPIDNDKIQMDYDRDHHSGVSSCTASYPVAYKK